MSPRLQISVCRGGVCEAICVAAVTIKHAIVTVAAQITGAQTSSTNANVITQVVDAQTSANAFIIAATQITDTQTSSVSMQRQLVVCGSAGPAKASSRSILRKCQESMSSKGVLQEGQVRVYHESVK